MQSLALLLTFVVGCSTGTDPGASGPTGPLAFPNDDDGKFDVFGRSLAGVAAPYVADPTLRGLEEELHRDARLRREVAWEIAARALEPVPLLGYAELAEREEAVELPEGEVPTVPRFQTWYGVDDFKRMFQQLYEDLGAEGRVERRRFTDEALEAAEVDNARAVDRSRRWPLERYLRFVERLGECAAGTTPEECARQRQSSFSGGTGANARITYSPATIRHLLRSYPDVLRCLDELDTLEVDAVPASEENFALCFEREFPEDAALVKAQWVRADFDMGMPAYDTDAETLARVTGPSTSGDWAAGDRAVDPSPEEVLTIQLRNGSTYRLSGIHVMTKETRHWMWVTLWWSDRPDEDFGEDRPESFSSRVAPVFQNYKLCVATDYEERDPDPAASLAPWPSLAAAYVATSPGDGPSWCSNPYIEHGRGNARTNCIGCHQHGAATVGEDLDGDGALDPFDLERLITDDENFPAAGRFRVRDVFPGDYLWSLTRVDDLAHVIRHEVDHFEFVDADSPARRAQNVVALGGEAAVGAELFAEHCAACHGPTGTGTGAGPSLVDRVPTRDDESIARTLITGRGPMPAWGDRFDDQILAHLFAYLRTTFGAQL